MKKIQLTNARKNQSFLYRFIDENKESIIRLKKNKEVYEDPKSG